MKKQILNLGKLLNKVEQKQIQGGALRFCRCDRECGSGHHCCSYRCYAIDAPNYPTGNCPPLMCPILE